MDKSFLFRNESNTAENLQTGAVFIRTLTDRNILSLIKNPDIDENIRGLLLQEAEKRGLDFIDKNYPETIPMGLDSQDLDQVQKEQGSQDAEDTIPMIFEEGATGRDYSRLYKNFEEVRRQQNEPVPEDIQEIIRGVEEADNKKQEEAIRKQNALTTQGDNRHLHALENLYRDDIPLLDETPKVSVFRGLLNRFSKGRLVRPSSQVKEKASQVVEGPSLLVDGDGEKRRIFWNAKDVSYKDLPGRYAGQIINKAVASETVDAVFREIFPSRKASEIVNSLKKQGLIQERIPLQNQKLLEKAKHHITQAVEGYKRAPLPAKLALSGVLLGTSLIGAMTGSSLLVAGAIAGKALVRGAGSYIAGKTVEEYLSKPGKASSMRGKISRIANVFGKHKARHEQDEEKLEGLRKHVFEVAEKNKNERFIRNTKWATMLSTFLLGSYADKDLMHVVGDKLHVLTDQFHQVFSDTPSLSQHIPPSDIHPTVSEVIPTESAPSSLPTIAPQEVVSNYSSTGITHVYEVIARKGETLIGVLLRDGLTEILPIDDLDKLTPLGRQNLILNIVEKLTPEQLREVGILSGDKNLIQAGAHIDIKKIAEFARTMTVNTSEGKVGIIERALSLQS
jgi:hypothetical protein